jgi:hypothetical protein
VRSSRVVSRLSRSGYRQKWAANGSSSISREASMAALDLVQLFESLVAPMRSANGNDLAAVPIPSIDTHRIAKDANGSPCLLIRQAPQSVRSAPIRLENLRVSFNVPCTVTSPGGNQEHDVFTIVRCVAANPALFPHFLRIISPIVVALGPTPTQAEVRRAISGLVELFQTLTAPGNKTIQGLWAELLLIRLSSNPAALASAWHRDPLEHFDFADGPQRIEVKSNSSRRREHYFSLDQLTPSGGSRIVICSVFAERAGGGVSLRKMADDIRGLLAGDATLVARFDAAFYSSLGSGWAEVMDESFDWELATGSIAFYSAESVPRPHNPKPQAIFEVRFRSDLSSATPLTAEQLTALGPIFIAALPARH